MMHFNTNYQQCLIDLGDRYPAPPPGINQDMLPSTTNDFVSTLLTDAKMRLHMITIPPHTADLYAHIATIGDCIIQGSSGKCYTLAYAIIHQMQSMMIQNLGGMIRDELESVKQFAMANQMKPSIGSDDKLPEIPADMQSAFNQGMAAIEKAAQGVGSHPQLLNMQPLPRQEQADLKMEIEIFNAIMKNYSSKLHVASFEAQMNSIRTSAANYSQATTGEVTKLQVSKTLRQELHLTFKLVNFTLKNKQIGIQVHCND